MVSNDWNYQGASTTQTAPQGPAPGYYDSIPPPVVSNMTVSTAGQQGLGSYNWNSEPIGSCYCTQSTHSFECKHMEKCKCGKASRVAPAALEMDVKGL